MSKEYTTALHPPGPTPLSLTSPTNPPILQDALQIRLQVFVHEQNCSALTEIDSDDTLSWHWVLYSGTTAVGTIRLVPPHANQHEKGGEAHEPCIKLTRVAIVPEYRGLGLGRRLVETALGWAVGMGRGELMGMGWRGLVLVHAQIGVEGMYGRVGFVVDEGLGRWDEEGIEHCGMFRRVGLD
ncbi:unnamed protein product [Penicillium salamii]|nr:unnamed protein product [Penicillium salamii]